MAREEDYELVRRLSDHDREVADAAFEELYEKYADRVYSTCSRILGESNLARDALQATFVLVLRKAHKFDFRSAFSSWLYRVAVNQCIDLRRRRDRHRPVSLSEPETAFLAERGDRRREPEPGPAERASRTEIGREIGREVSRLNPRLSAVVVLRYVQGLGYEEIAEVLDVPLGTVKSRLSRAHAALEAVLGPRLDELI